jgi:hypothetical protein
MFKASSSTTSIQHISRLLSETPEIADYSVNRLLLLGDTNRAEYGCWLSPSNGQRNIRERAFN